MKVKPLSNEHASYRRPAQDEARSEAPGECVTGQLTDKAQRCARELMASVPCEKDGKTVPIGPAAEALAALMSRRFGKMAPTVAAWCAMLAWSEGADACYRMWAEAFKTVRTVK